MATIDAPRYEIGELVASGGMADVYRGYDRVLRRPVAIKRLRGPADDTAARERFTREALVLAGFNHPNAVAVYDTFVDATGPLIVMEYVEGTTLRGVLRAEGRLSVATATAIAGQVLAALAAAHARGIVHRDVKPGNVLVAEDGQVKLADFGIATMHDAADLTRTGEVVGTPRYLSPEQAGGHRATPRSDLYAVGVLLFEMVCGRPPFEGDSPEVTMSAHRDTPVPPLAARCPGVPDRYVAVVERALAKDPAQRYPDAAAMRAAVLAGAEGDATIVDSTVDLPVVVRADPPPTSPVVWWSVVLFAIVGILVAVGVWALGDPDAPPVGSEPTPTEVVTLPQPATLPPTTPSSATVVPTVMVTTPPAGAWAAKPPKPPKEQPAAKGRGRGRGDPSR